MVKARAKLIYAAYRQLPGDKRMEVEKIWNF